MTAASADDPGADDLARAQVRAAVEAVSAVSDGAPDVLAVLIAWGLLSDDIQGMDEDDQRVLAALQSLRLESTDGEPDLQTLQ